MRLLGKKRTIINPIISIALIVCANVFFVFLGAGAVETEWLLVMVFTLSIAIMSATLITFILKDIFSLNFIMGLLVFSFSAFLIYMFSMVGTQAAQQYYFTPKIDALNETVDAKVYDEVDLGEGKTIYCKGQQGHVFGLNFEFEGKKEISEQRIVSLAQEWLRDNQFEVKYTSLAIIGKRYRKSLYSFDLLNPGEFLIQFDIIKGPSNFHNGVTVEPKYKNGQLTFDYYQ